MQWVSIERIASVVDLFMFIYLIIQIITYRMKISKYNKMTRRFEDMKRIDYHEVIVNISGHSIQHSTNEWMVGHQIIDIPFHVKFENTDDLLNEVEKVYESIPEDIRGVMETGSSVVVAIPGMSNALSLLLIIIHAATGHFPLITFAIMDKAGRQIYQEPIDLQHLRNVQRAKRDINRNRKVTLHESEE